MSQEEKCRQAVQNGINHEENQEIFWLLLRFCKCQNELTSYKRKVREVIHTHLLSLNKPPRTESKYISEICETAIEILSSKEEDPSFPPNQKERISIPHQFQNKWLANVPSLLPEENEVLQCLPYLLTCYTQNIGKHQIDPFDENVRTGGWDDIFKPRDMGEGNRSRSIRIMEDCFLDFPEKVEFSDLFNCGDKYIYSTEPSDELLYDYMVLLQEPNWRKAQKEASTYVKGWELYRRFASFCEACSNVEGVNITLSMALFSNGMTHSYEPIKRISDDIDVYSYEEVAQDLLRSDILSLTRKYDEYGGLKAIHEHAYHARLLYLDYLDKKAFQ